MKKTILMLTLFLMIGLNGRTQINKTIDSIVQNAVSSESFEGTVLIAKDGDVVYQKSFGFKDEDKLLPINNSTRFSIASITKLFTAIITLQLVEEGKFKLTDNLEALVPELNIPEAKRITVHHLLLHISGLPNENDEIYRQLTNPRGFVSKTIVNESNDFGSFNYANLDYVLLGLIIEKFDKRSYEQSVEQRILDYCSMDQTGFLKKGSYPEDFAFSSTYTGSDRRQKDPLFFIENYYAAGAMYSTAQDLLKLDQALYDHEFLGEESKALMFTSYPEYNYSGYSVWTYNYPFAQSKPRVMERRGGILGANSVLIRLLEKNRTIIILSNNNKFNPDSFGDIGGLKEALMIAIAETGP